MNAKTDEEDGPWRSDGGESTMMQSANGDAGLHAREMRVAHGGDGILLFN